MRTTTDPLRIHTSTTLDLRLLFPCSHNPHRISDAVPFECGHMKMEASLHFSLCRSRGADTIPLSHDHHIDPIWRRLCWSWSSQPVFQLCLPQRDIATLQDARTTAKNGNSSLNSPLSELKQIEGMTIAIASSEYPTCLKYAEPRLLWKEHGRSLSSSVAILEIALWSFRFQELDCW